VIFLATPNQSKNLELRQTTPDIYHSKRGAKAVFHLFVRTQTKGLYSTFPGRLRANARKKQAKKQKQMKKHDQYADISSFS
jgi:hypothetical protein